MPERFRKEEKSADSKLSIMPSPPVGRFTLVSSFQITKFSSKRLTRSHSDKKIAVGHQAIQVLFPSMES